jgi:hypothetical protein
VIEPLVPGSYDGHLRDLSEGGIEGQGQPMAMR